eukprot:8673551-Alexandrium_andersonii.AAC.1
MARICPGSLSADGLPWPASPARLENPFFPSCHDHLRKGPAEVVRERGRGLGLTGAPGPPAPGDL